MDAHAKVRDRWTFIQRQVGVEFEEEDPVSGDAAGDSDKPFGGGD